MNFKFISFSEREISDEYFEGILNWIFNYMERKHPFSFAAEYPESWNMRSCLTNAYQKIKNIIFYSKCMLGDDHVKYSKLSFW